MIGLLLVLAGAGAGAGMTIFGDRQSDGPTTVDQAVIAENVTGDGTLEGVGAVRNDNTSFKFSANVDGGDTFTITINLSNRANRDVVGRLVLDIPEQLEVDVAGNTNTSLERMDANRWQFRIDDTSPDAGSTGKGDDVRITVAVPDDGEARFYTIEGEIRPDEDSRVG